MYPSSFTDNDRSSDEEVDAAARELHRWGGQHGWWPESVPAYEALDPIGKKEFDAIIERVLITAAVARRLSAVSADGTDLRL